MNTNFILKRTKRPYSRKKRFEILLKRRSGHKPNRKAWLQDFRRPAPILTVSKLWLQAVLFEVKATRHKISSRRSPFSACEIWAGRNFSSDVIRSRQLVDGEWDIRMRSYICSHAWMRIINERDSERERERVETNLLWPFSKDLI